MTDMLSPPGEWTPGAIHHHFSILLNEIEKTTTTRFDDLQAQIDRRLDTQIRERRDSEERFKSELECIRRETDLRFESLKDADKRAERERAAAADVLSRSLTERITSGDAQLREHIVQQVEQLRGMIEGTRRELDIRHGASQEAIRKQDAATEKRFEAVNEFREQLREQTSQFIPREVAEKEFNRLAQRIEEQKERLDKASGQELGEEKSKSARQLATGKIIAAIAATGSILGGMIVAANALTG